MSSDLVRMLDPAVLAGRPPPGAVNVRVGHVIEGPGGKWVPCVTEVGRGVYYSSLFQVGPGRHQVCATDFAMPSIDKALVRAIALASAAAS